MRNKRLLFLVALIGFACLLVSVYKIGYNKGYYDGYITCEKHCVEFCKNIIEEGQKRFKEKEKEEKK